jgi:hypothetical protein
VILAKRRENEVALVLQPQRAAFPGFSGAAVVGVGVPSTGPRGMSRACSRDPAADRDPAPAATRRDSRRKPPDTRRATPHEPRELYKAPGWPGRHQVPTRPRAPSSQTGFVTAVLLSELLNLSLAAGAVSTGLRTYQGHAAARWPPASLDSSYAPRNRQLREEQGESGQACVLPRTLTLCHKTLPKDSLLTRGFLPPISGFTLLR